MCLADYRLIEAVRIFTQVVEGDRQHLSRRVEHGNAAALELGEVFRLEHQVPAVNRRIGAEGRLHLGFVVADARGSP